MSILKYPEIVSPFLQGKILYHADKLRELNNSEIVAPITCEIDLTDGACNNKCKYCFFNNNSNSNLETIDKNRLFELLVELKKMGVKAIELAGGGEPLMHPDFQEIIDYIDSLNFKFGIVTNGLLLNKYHFNKKNLEFIRVSLDAATPDVYQVVHGVNTFDRVINNIESIVNRVNSNKIGIGFLIVPENISDIVPAAKLTEKLGCRFIQYRPASIIGNVDADIWNSAKQLVNRLKSESYNCQIFDGGVKWNNIVSGRQYTRCSTSSLVGVIKANGDVPLCILNRNCKEKIIGNIYEEQFEKIWFSELHHELIRNIDVHLCRRPCKHDVYNIIVEALDNNFFHIDFV